jgi:hypothetical protein
MPVGRDVHRNKKRRLKSELGLVSRVTPVHTAMHNCTRDEGRSFEVGSAEAGVMLVERRGQVIAVELGPTGSYRGGARWFSGRRQPSCGGTSRMTRECQVRICEGLGVKFPGPTRHEQTDRPRWCRVCFSSLNRLQSAAIARKRGYRGSCRSQRSSYCLDPG